MRINTKGNRLCECACVCPIQLAANNAGVLCLLCRIGKCAVGGWHG